MRRPALAMLRAAIAFAAVVAACGAFGANAGDGSVVDGWLVGPVTTCRDVVVTSNDVEVARGRCVDLIAAAAKALDKRDPGHPAVAAMELHERRWPPNTCCGLQYVAVYRLVDGSVRGIGVGWPGVATTPFTIDYGP